MADYAYSGEIPPTQEVTIINPTIAEWPSHQSSVMPEEESSNGYWPSMPDESTDYHNTSHPTSCSVKNSRAKLVGLLSSPLKPAFGEGA